MREKEAAGSVSMDITVGEESLNRYLSHVLQVSSLLPKV